LWVLGMELTLCHYLASRILRRVLDFWKVYTLSLSLYICIYIYTMYIEDIAEVWVGEVSA